MNKLMGGKNMDLTTSLISTAMTMQQQQIQQSVSVALMDKMMENEQANAMALIEDIAQVPAAAPPSNHIIDLLA